MSSLSMCFRANFLLRAMSCLKPTETRFRYEYSPRAPVGICFASLPYARLEEPQVAEHILDGGTEPREVLGNGAAPDGVADIPAHGGGGHRRPAQRDEADVGRSEGQTLQDVVLHDEAAGHRHLGQGAILLVEAVHDAPDDALQRDGRDAPLVHHPDGAVSRAATGAVEGDEVDARLRGDVENRHEVTRVEGAGLEADTLGPEAAERGDPPDERLRVPHRELADLLEDRTDALRVGLGDRRIEGVGVDDVAELPEAKRVLQARDPSHPLDTLRGLTELQLDGRDAEPRDGELEDAVELVVVVGLEDDVPEPPVIPPEGLDHLRDQRGRDDPRLVDDEARVFGHHVLADDHRHPGEGRSGEVVPPVELRHGGKDERRPDRDLVLESEPRGDVDVREGRLARILGRPTAPNTRPFTLKWEKSRG